MAPYTPIHCPVTELQQALPIRIFSTVSPQMKLRILQEVNQATPVFFNLCVHFPNVKFILSLLLFDIL